VNVIRIATRGSALALWQARHVAKRLETAHPGLRVSLTVLKTTGDKILDVPLAKVGGKGLFVKEIEDAVAERRADLAVHSMKDVPATLPEGLTIAAISEREDPRDAWLSPSGARLDDLPAGARVGTSSLRRTSQLRSLRSDLTIVPLRGNVDTRVRKLREGQFEAVVLAAAGLRRLGLESHITELLPVTRMLPAIAQGALGLEIRADDDVTRALLGPLHHETSALCVRAERAFLRRLGGDCNVPVAGYATLEGELRLRGLVAHPDGTRMVRGERQGSAAAPEAVGEALAEELLGRGAEEVLRELRAGAGA
jgi:hydroxymethylbilane synthase